MTTRETIEKYWNHLLKGEFLPAFDMFAEDGSYTVGGMTPASGTYSPKSVINGEFLAVIASMFAKGTPIFTAKDIIVEGNRGVIIAKGECEGEYGHFKQDYCFYITVEQGEIKTLVEFIDSLPLETALMGGHLVRKDGTIVS